MTWFVLGLFLFLMIDLLVFARFSAKRRERRQTTLSDVWAQRKNKLQLDSAGRIDRLLLQHTPRAELESLIRTRFRNKFDVFSVDYQFDHFNPITNRHVPAGWVKGNDLRNEATVYFYTILNKPAPPPPPPPPPPVKEAWSEADEKHRLELFRAGRSAFWLNPDWDKARETGEPFWMFDPAPLPEDKPFDVVQALAEEMVYSGTEIGIERTALDDRRRSFLIYLPDHNGEYVTVKEDEYRRARRLALSMMKSK